MTPLFTPIHAARRLVALVMLAYGAVAAGEPRPAASGRSLVLVTLDTTRADALGCYGARAPTPALDGLARRGLRYARALSASPLTLPAHASLLTGLEPPEHGVLDNGSAVLPEDIPTLATRLAGRGYATAAFVGSRMLDRRFGLARGFERYDERMAAELVGEYGYPERDATAVTTAALAWLQARSDSRPFFLWVHYYDAHAPYAAPGSSPAARYAGEVAAVDRELARLFAALPAGAQTPVVVAVGDHGESLGEHGEQGHGLFLYGTVLRVPLLLAGPGVPAGRVVDETVATRRMAATLLQLVGTGDGLPGPGLPGLPGPTPEPQPVYSETWLPASAYGWSPLRALSNERWHLVEAPRSELYDVKSDPQERSDQAGRQAAEMTRLKRLLRVRLEALKPRAAASEPDPETAHAVRSLGYLSGASGARVGTLDPKDGQGLLLQLDEAKRWLSAGRSSEALARLRELCARSPGNVPFLTQLASAQLATDDAAGAATTLRAARDLNPRSEFLHVHLGQTYLRLGYTEDARASFEQALAVNPRAAAAWLALGELAKSAGRADEERAVLLRAAAAGTTSAALLTRLGQLELAAGQSADAERHLREATELLPGFSAAWLVWAAAAEKQGQLDAALERYTRAAAAEPSDSVFLQLGRVRLARGEPALARQDLAHAAALGPRSAAGREARRLLATLAQ